MNIILCFIKELVMLRYYKLSYEDLVGIAKEFGVVLSRFEEGDCNDIIALCDCKVNLKLFTNRISHSVTVFEPIKQNEQGLYYVIFE